MSYTEPRHVSRGGSFQPAASYDITGDWNFATPPTIGDASLPLVQQSDLVPLQTTNQQTRETWTATARAVMASPPTVTIGTGGAASTIVSAVFKSYTDAAFRYSGVKAGVGPSFPQSSYLAPDNLNYQGTGVIFAGGVWGVEFMFDGTSLEWRTTGNGAKYRLTIDGQLVTAGGASGPAADGNTYRVLVAFGSRANRRVRIELSGNGRFGGVDIGPNDTVWAPASPTWLSAVLLGDSFTEGTGGTTVIEGLGVLLGDLLRWNVTATGLGGTGYLNAATGGKVKFRDRLTKDVVNYNPDVVIVAGGINDTGFTKSAVQTEARLLFGAIVAALPKARIYALGPFWPNGSPTQAATDVRDALQTAANQIGVTFLDTITSPWITGSGKVGTTTGTGNADLYTSSDGTHPTDAGHAYLAHRIASAIAATW